MDSLPEELVSIIFSYFDSTPPSETKNRKEPSLELTSCSETPLKSICRVSKRWRRIALPLLFSCARLQLDGRVPLGSTDFCYACGLPINEAPLESEDIEGLHQELAKTACGLSSKLSEPLFGYKVPYQLLTSKQLPGIGTVEQSAALCALMFYHQLVDMLAFLEHEKITKDVRSFVVLRNKIPSWKPLTAIGLPNPGWRHLGAALFWRQLFTTIDPRRVAILAPPGDLAYLTNTTMDSTHEWAFGDMDFHLLEFRNEDHDLVGKTQPQSHSHASDGPPKSIAAYSRTSVLCSRPWTHLALNEGSFLQSYGTYEYFERGPPSIVHDVNHLLAHYGSPLPKDSMGPQPCMQASMPFVRSFTYTGIFPFANHANFDQMLPLLEELDCRFAPNPDSGILDDKQRVGRAQLQDCWQELFTAYEAICSALETGRGAYPRLTKFICGDSRITGISDDLDYIFTPLCLPEWIEPTPGVFHRLDSFAPGPNLKNGLGEDEDD